MYGVLSKTGPGSTISPAATADWQTYKNEKYGFEFKYPTELKKRDLPSNFINYSNHLLSLSPEPVMYEVLGAITAYDINVDLYQASFIDSLSSFEEEINGVSIVRSDTYPWGQEGYRGQRVILSQGGRKIVISYSANSFAFDRYSPIFNTILSTFKFTK